MLKVLLFEFVIYCKNLALANNSIKELNRYIRQFDEYLQENDLSELSQLQYKQLIAFVIVNIFIDLKLSLFYCHSYFEFNVGMANEQRQNCFFTNYDISPSK